MLLVTAASMAQLPDTTILAVRAPETFQAEFNTSKGSFIIEAYRNWSPLGVDRLYQLIKTGFYDNTLLFRVEPKYVIQFGLNDNVNLNKFWGARKIADEPLQTQNLAGVISYARGGQNDRTTQLFINTVDNPKLDTIITAGLKGFTPVAKIISGMEVIRLFNDEHGRKALMAQDSLRRFGNAVFEQQYPRLDRILTARILAGGSPAKAGK
ncbi:MAG: peptidylprolyl isomerase [Sediminibacterium sp.]|nr:peptidylprolyl isomerase [Sediminibacterium sp.]